LTNEKEHIIFKLTLYLRKMKMKKPTVLCLVLVLALIALSACNTNESNPGNNPDLDKESLFVSSYGSGGTLTITDIPSQFNGNYTSFNASLDDLIYIRGYQSIDESTDTTTLSQIIDGSVSIPLYLWKNNTAGNSFDSESSYTGNETVTGSEGGLAPCLLIFGGDKQSPLIDPIYLATIAFASISFSNGSAVVSASTGTLSPAQNPGGLPGPGKEYTYTLSGNTITFTAPFLGNSVIGTISGNQLSLVADGETRVFIRDDGDIASPGNGSNFPLSITSWTYTYAKDGIELVDVLRFFSESTGIVFTMPTGNVELY
jgi:hypothetical protein